MSIIFYDHLVNKEEIFLLIDSLPEPDNQKSRARQLVDDIIHHSVIGHILEKLDQKKHKTFLSLVEERPFDPEIIIFIRQHTHPDIEDEIRHIAQLIIEDIKKDFIS